MNCTVVFYENRAEPIMTIKDKQLVTLRDKHGNKVYMTKEEICFIFNKIIEALFDF